MIVPAAFQRPYMWTRHDVEAFWKSLTNGWPVGSLMLWNPAVSVDRTNTGRTRIGPIENNASEWVTMLLDGQNRMATLAWSLAMPDDVLPDADTLSERERETWMSGMNLVCDYDTRSVRFVPEEEMNIGYRLPAAVLGDSILMNRSFRALYKEGLLDDEPMIWMDSMAQKVREARVTCTTLNDATPEEAVEVFRNIARVGQPVSEEDLENAIGWLSVRENRPGFLNG